MFVHINEPPIGMGKGYAWSHKTMVWHITCVRPLLIACAWQRPGVLRMGSLRHYAHSFNQDFAACRRDAGLCWPSSSAAFGPTSTPHAILRPNGEAVCVVLALSSPSVQWLGTQIINSVYKKSLCARLLAAVWASGLCAASCCSGLATID